MSVQSSLRLGAWSRRRAAVQAETDAIALEEKQVEIAIKHEELAQKSETEVLAELELPQPDDMQAGDDFAAFMKDTVPTVLRNRALRKLWLSDPVLANVDNLVDYGEDFAAEGKLGGVIKTIYRVGKGMLPDEVEEPEVEPVVDLETDDPTDDNDETVIEELETEDEFPVAVLPEEMTPIAEEQNVVPLVQRRKMRFSFDEDTTAPLANVGNE